MISTLIFQAIATTAAVNIRMSSSYDMPTLTIADHNGLPCDKNCQEKFEGLIRQGVEAASMEAHTEFIRMEKNSLGRTARQYNSYDNMYIDDQEEAGLCIPKRAE